MHILQVWIYTLHMYLSKSSSIRAGGVGLGAVYHAPGSAWDAFFQRGYFAPADSIAVIAIRFAHTHTAASWITNTDGIIVRIAQDHHDSNIDSESYLRNVWTMLKQYHDIRPTDEEAKRRRELKAYEIRKYVFQERYRVWFHKIKKYKAQAQEFVAIAREVVGGSKSDWQVPHKIPLRTLAGVITKFITFVEDSESEESFTLQYCESAFEELEASYPAYLKYAADYQVQGSW
ncbi:hypothetical protein NLI96_g3112 [Meripilus lineatus]|uniref:Uncharacterized protein n=1 Tax=Meripilus lineatus TaxID=2056292 RepID=A0AAD5V9L8_9APHY|nr:hypothetical protein NLI96_g3112 [Physisporinus lineatus]